MGYLKNQELRQEFVSSCQNHTDEPESQEEYLDQLHQGRQPIPQPVNWETPYWISHFWEWITGKI